MGYDDDIPSTENYITAGQFPRFVIYDVSDSSYYDANIYDNHIFEGALLAMYSINSLKVEIDCAGTLGGDHVLDNCGICADSDDPPEGWPCPYDCEGIAGGAAFIDDCGICSGGNTGHMANSDQDDCGDCCLGGPDDLECWNANHQDHLKHNHHSHLDHYLPYGLYFLQNKYHSHQ
jgi:hypothetical protein